ncbi:MAG TPA: hypothetical protein VE197_21850, partial [Mycobacterium sp.]|nr:hypothetical protein [Mycobacterium sp.]
MSTAVTAGFHPDVFPTLPAVSSRARFTIGRSGAMSRARRRPAGRLGDRVLWTLCAGAGLAVTVTLFAVVYQLVHNGNDAISRFGLGFLTQSAWKPGFNVL